MAENLDGMSPEQLMLRDVIYEMHDLLRDAQSETLPGYRLGVAAVASLLKHQLEVFDIDQSRFARQMPDVDAWLAGAQI